MSVKKRVASMLLALGMLATTAPAFAADTAEAAGELAVQKGAAISKNVAAEGHSYIELGASVKGQSVVSGQTMNAAVLLYLHESSNQNGERVIFNIAKGGKNVHSEAIPYSDFEEDAGLYVYYGLGAGYFG